MTDDVSAWDSAGFCAPHPVESAQALSCEPESGAADANAADEAETLRLSGLEAVLTEHQAHGDGVDLARQTFEHAQELERAGLLEDAVLQLRVLERVLPRITDRIALERGRLLARLGLPVQACEAYAVAAESPDRGISIRAQIGGVECLIAAADRRADAALAKLLRRYPQLSQRSELSLGLALMRLRSGDVRGGVTLLRRVDLDAPASAAAARAREQLAQLAGQGVRIAPYSGSERVDRAERLWREGPFEPAQLQVEALLEEPKLTKEVRARVHLLAAKIARQQGRWQVVRDELDAARAAGAPAEETVELLPPSAPTEAPESSAAELERRLRALRAGRAPGKLKNAQVHALLELCIAHRARDLCDEALTSMATGRGFLPTKRFEAAMRAAGLASDDKVAAVLETLFDIPSYRMPARYHYARALERMGRRGEAEAEYMRVISRDRSATPYYAMWSDLRLWAMRGGAQESCLPEPALAASMAPPSVAAQAGLGSRAAVEADPIEDEFVGPPPLSGAARSLLGSLIDATPAQVGGALRPLPPIAAPEPDSSEPELLELLDPVLSQAAAQEPPAEPTDPEAARARAIELLEPIAELHGEAYPWLLRALDLIRLGRMTEAADELSETYLAWRDSGGAPRLRSGLLALLTGDAPPRRPATFAVKKARRALDAKTRLALSEVASLCGDPGIGLRFGTFVPNKLPRAYEELVESSARKYGLDPNLLFAVMRVESIYNRRIVSTAGAIGLMQIMPGTGRRIAKSLGVETFEVSDLLDPQLNVEFSAWYLASLLERFDGRLPLAIASYNGGPHNVRLWMRRSTPDMPLDAFLEQIPFSQTHRYVRRVLTHYAAYRAQQNLPMTRLSVDLPPLRPDAMAF